MTPLLERALELYHLPLFDLIDQAHQVHRQFHHSADIQRCVLLSIKTGGCPEDCGYCSQSAHHDANVPRQSLLALEEVRAAALRAKERGATRFCMGAAWRSPPNGEPFERVLNMVREVRAIGLEACATLGMLNQEQADSLKEAGLDAYNHNLDTSREFYGQIITTRTYDDRLRTIAAVRKAGIAVCCGGILGLGESELDRCRLLAELASMQPQPESVPINLLVPIEGTPLASADPVKSTDLIRVIAVACILMPQSRVRLSAGRHFLNREAQLLAFFAGARSIFIGDKLLTTANVAEDDDACLLAEVSA
ncbi:biotin synthase BioB [Acidipila sp. 4G-K13]|nr:biotin synthase BioB [Paracidobacterium acidisoli]